MHSYLKVIEILCQKTQVVKMKGGGVRKLNVLTYATL